jgi:hypothetical protein
MDVERRCNDRIGRAKPLPNSRRPFMDTLFFPMNIDVFDLATVAIVLETIQMHFGTY